MALFETLGLLAAVVALVYWYCTKNNSYWAARGVPFSKPTFLVGSLFDTLIGKRNPGQIHEDIYNAFKGEPVAGLFHFLKPALMIRDPGLINRILTSEFHHFSANDFTIDEDQDPVLAKNIFVQRGEKWKRSRQALSPAFTASRVKATYDKIQSIADKLVRHLEKNPENEVKSTMSLYTSEIVAGWGCGIDGHSFEDEDPILQKLGKMMFQPSLWSSIAFTIMGFIPKLAKMLNIKFVPNEVPNFFNGVVSDLMANRMNSDVQHKDFLQYFMDLKKKRSISINDDQNEVTDSDILAGIVSFFLEGYETSSLILSLLLQELTINEKVQEELRQEIDEMYKNGPATYDSTSELPYLSKVMSETVRLYGGLSLTKVCTESCNLDLGNGKTLFVEKDTSIVIPLHAVHCDPAYWPNPSKFDPSRFNKDAVIAKGTYFPFGEGPRVCIGMRIAHAIIKTAVVSILRNFDLLKTKKTAPKFVQDQTHFMSSQLGGVHIRFAKRQNRAL